MKTGGFKTAKPDQPEFAEVYRAVAEEVNARLGRDKADRAEITSAATQVVAGVNLRLGLRFKDGATANVVVYTDLKQKHKLSAVEGKGDVRITGQAAERLAKAAPASAAHKLEGDELDELAAALDDEEEAKEAPKPAAAPASATQKQLEELLGRQSKLLSTLRELDARADALAAGGKAQGKAASPAAAAPAAAAPAAPAVELKEEDAAALAAVAEDLARATGLAETPRVTGVSVEPIPVIPGPFPARNSRTAIAVRVFELAYPCGAVFTARVYCDRMRGVTALGAVAAPGDEEKKAAAAAAKPAKEEKKAEKKEEKKAEKKKAEKPQQQKGDKKQQQKQQQQPKKGGGKQQQQQQQQPKKQNEDGKGKRPATSRPASIPEAQAAFEAVKAQVAAGAGREADAKIDVLSCAAEAGQPVELRVRFGDDGTVLNLVVAAGATPSLTSATEEADKMAKQAYKKFLRAADAAAKKEAKRLARESETKAAEERKEAERAARLAAASQVVLEEPCFVPPSPQVAVGDVAKYVGKRVQVTGWVHRLRNQGSLMFFELRDGTGFPGLMQIVLQGRLTETLEALTLAREACVCVQGFLHADERAVGGVEMKADYWRVVGPSSGDIENLYNRKSDVSVVFDNRHIHLRELDNMYLLRARSFVNRVLEEHFLDQDYTQVWPPAMVQTQVEGGSTLFKIDYFGEEAYLTQSSQLYLETVVPSLGKVFCNVPSYRAERCRTRRHMNEFVHFEAELGNITFEDLLNVIEGMVVETAERFQREQPELLKALNPGFQVPKRPFRRMDYSDAIEYCRANNIYKDEEKKEHFEFGDDIPEAPERRMTDMIGEPILLCRFPAHMKSFYMQRCPENPELTESVDLLMPGVGEIVGGSMRSWDYKQLTEGFEREGIDPSKYYWYTDLRKYGSCPHGGWGLGSERFLCWLLNQHHIRQVAMYPRFTGRCTP